MELNPHLLRGVTLYFNYPNLFKMEKPKKKGLFWRVVKTLHSALGKLLELKPENEHGLQK